MNENTKRLILDELNNLETVIFVAEETEDYTYAAGKQKGILETLKNLGYKIVKKHITICGDDTVMYVGIESEVQ